MPGIPGLPDEGEAVVEPSALQASPQADAAAAVMQFSAAAAAAVAAAPYVTSKMEVDAAAAGRPIPKLRCPTCGVTREVELIQQQTGAPKIRYISGPTYVSTGRKGVQKCSCKGCGFFSLNPPRDDDAAATTAASASVAAAAAAPAVTAAPPAVTATSAAASASAVAAAAAAPAVTVAPAFTAAPPAATATSAAASASAVAAAAAAPAVTAAPPAATATSAAASASAVAAAAAAPAVTVAPAFTAAPAVTVAPAFTAAPPAATATSGHGRVVCRELSSLTQNSKAPVMQFSVGSKVQGKWGALRGGTQWLPAVVISTGSCTYSLRYEDDGQVEENVAPQYVRPASMEGRHASQVSMGSSGEAAFDNGTGRLPRLAQLHGKRLRFGSFIGEVVGTRQRANRDSQVGILWRQAWAADPRCRKCRKCASCPDLGDGSLTFEDDLSVQDVLTRLSQQSEGVVYPSERYPGEIRQGTRYQATIPASTVGVSGDDSDGGGGAGAERGGDKERLAGLVETVIEVVSSMEHAVDAVEEVQRALRALTCDLRGSDCPAKVSSQ